ncbi:MAG: CapA family protein [Sandaracinaceae bacterium]|nr:CapA family protein [Sandaracinaceae bacterium]
MRSKSPRTARDALVLRPLERVLYGAVIRLARWSGIWRRGRDARGDLERMGLLDKIYWVYKTTAPVRHARRGSDLEAYFAAPQRRACALPAGFDEHRTATVTAAGDLGPHPWLARSTGKLHHDVADLLFGADLAMANLECVAEPPDAGVLRFDSRSGPTLALDREELDAILGHGGAASGFVATACNHSLDYDAAGVDTTIAALRRRGLAFHGICARGDEPSLPTIVERAGVRLGLVAWTFGLNGRRPPLDRPGIVASMDLGGRAAEVDLAPLARQLDACRRAEVDFVIAHLHWGLEHEMYPTPDQVALAHRMAELGVDAIVGHHPHVIQPWELYRTRRDPGSPRPDLLLARQPRKPVHRALALPRGRRAPRAREGQPPRRAAHLRRDVRAPRGRSGARRRERDDPPAPP